MHIFVHIVALQIPKDKCISESGKIYNIGSVFTDNDCTSKCECLKDGVVSCEPMCAVARNDNSCAKIKIVDTPVGLSDAQGNICSCPSFLCLQGIKIKQLPKQSLHRKKTEKL